MIQVVAGLESFLFPSSDRFPAAYVKPSALFDD